MKFLLVLALCLSTAFLTHAFSLTEVSPDKTSVKEGEDVTFSCTADTWYEWCTFTHNNKKCDYEWQSGSNVKQLDCNGYEEEKHFLRF